MPWIIPSTSSPRVAVHQGLESRADRFRFRLNHREYGALLLRKQPSVIGAIPVSATSEATYRHRSGGK